jgi:hypothetical protein
MTILNVKLSNFLHFSSCCRLKEKVWKLFKLHSLGKRMTGEGPGTKKVQVKQSYPHNIIIFMFLVRISVRG